MKKIYVLITTLLLMTFSISSQSNPAYNWFKITSGTGGDLNFGNGEYIVGSSGILLKSTSHGLNWTLVNTGSNGNLKALQNASNNIVIVGDAGLILRSSNNGSSFMTVPSGTTNNLNSLVRIGTKYIAAGDGGVIVSSSNFGANWSVVPSGTSFGLNGISGISSVVAVGNNGTVTRSTDQGVTWNIISSGTTQSLYSVEILSNLAIAAGANGTIIRSTDAGATWQPMVSGVSSDLKCIDINNSENIVAAGNGTVISSTDMGITWRVISDNRLPNLNWRAAFIYNENELYVAGPSGNIYRKKYDSLYAPSFIFNANNIRTYINNTGIFNQFVSANNAAGFEWPAGTGKTAVFTSGLTSAAYVNGGLRLATASFKGELAPGYCINGTGITDSRFKLYKVEIDRPNDSDWNNWGRMISFGAPYTDVNNNGIYEPSIDKPGVKGAKQTIFICMTDAFPETHNIGEGFSGGTLPLGAEYHFTVWGYDEPGFSDIMFLKWVVINKSLNSWDSTIFSIVTDPDLGYADDDFIGCDSTKNFAYCYNADNDDSGGPNSYGPNPPATGTMFLNCSGSDARMTSCVYFNNSTYSGPSCERDPETPLEAYNFMKGAKKDGTPWINVLTMQATKFCFNSHTGGNGWSENNGRIENCGGSLTGPVVPSLPGDRRQVISYKPSVMKINPGDTQVILAAQFMARGSSNMNSLTLLQSVSENASLLCQNGFVIGINPISTEIPNKYSLLQNYPNPFNPFTKIQFALPKAGNTVIKIYDAIGREITTLVNDKLNAGVYSVDWNGSAYPSGVYFYRLQSGDYTDTRKMVLVK